MTPNGQLVVRVQDLVLFDAYRATLHLAGRCGVELRDQLLTTCSPMTAVPVG